MAGQDSWANRDQFAAQIDTGGSLQPRQSLIPAARPADGYIGLGIDRRALLTYH